MIDDDGRCMDRVQKHLLHLGEWNAWTKSKVLEEEVEPLHLELYRRKMGSKTDHNELALGTSERKQATDIPDERQGSEKESPSRQEGSLGKSRGRGAKSSVPKQSERPLHKDEATKRLPSRSQALEHGRKMVKSSSQRKKCWKSGKSISMSSWMWLVKKLLGDCEEPIEMDTDPFTIQ